eukprot:Gregarina_sp_Poly_1__5376@NODE_283_length_10075_cov_114_472622_g245_i0_p7_GENE_NODE_283_length_10075_cov_114_472622_g245_i0NODE_283_length_10075_cov_114_472622_g245_i0_p7_ORF_typecomplete_len176_score31_06Fip1/PF05182_13/0_0017_NODE_283_length_10075_cov_114_472622_g245_i029556
MQPAPSQSLQLHNATTNMSDDNQSPLSSQVSDDDDADEEDDDEPEIDVLLFGNSAAGDLQTFNEWHSATEAGITRLPFAHNNLAPSNAVTEAPVPPPGSTGIVLTFEQNRPWNRRFQRPPRTDHIPGVQQSLSDIQRSDWFNYDLTPDEFRAIITDEVEKRKLQQRVRKIEVDDE